KVVALGCLTLGHGAVDLVGRDLQEAGRLSRPARTVSSLIGGGAGGFGSTRLEEHVDADDPGGEERLRLQDRAVHVRFGGEVDHGVGIRHERIDDGWLGDVALYEAESARLLGIGFDRGKVRPIASVGELVEDCDPRAVLTSEHLPYEAAADEARSPGHQEVGAGSGPGSRRAPVSLATGAAHVRGTPAAAPSSAAAP